MLVGDFLDAYAGYAEAENERVKALAEIVRRSTWFLWNIQVDPKDRVTTAQELWPFEWDKGLKTESIEPEQRKQIEDCQADVIKNM